MFNVHMFILEHYIGSIVSYIIINRIFLFIFIGGVDHGISNRAFN